jgi:hypothetical protein
VVHDELAAPVEQLAERHLALRTFEGVLLLDLDHRQPPALGVEPVTRARQLLLLLEQLLALGQPLVSRYHVGQIERLRRHDAYSFRWM